MKREVKKLMSGALLLALATPAAALADDQALQKKVDELTRKVQKLEDKSLSKWLEIHGDYRFRVDSLKGHTVDYSNAIGTMNNLVAGFTIGPNAVAGGNIGGFTSPSVSAFGFMQQPGKLFSPSQFNTILNQYMPQAMAQALPSIFTAMQTGAFTPANTALTPQQQGILNTLGARVMPTVFAMQVGSIPGMLALLPPGTPATTTVGAVFGGLPPAQQQLAQQMLMQGFLGAPGPLNGNAGNLKTVPAYRPKNESLYTNRLGLDLHAKATQDVTVNVRLLAYKTFGSQDDSAVMNGGDNPFFADRVGVFDGTLGHVPSSGLLEVDRAYATWSNIADQPIWLSVGRRPSTNGAPSNLKLNTERPGNGGTPALLVDYAFDGMTIGWAPDIEALPGAYAKVCYGRAFESGYDKSQVAGNSLQDTDMLGVALIPLDTDPLRIWLQWNRGMEIFDFPVMNNTAFANTGPSVNLGSIDWYGGGFMSTLKNVGPGTLNFFADGALSVSHPNSNVSANAGFEGLMTGGFFNQDFNPSSKTGWATYLGARYDFPTRTKFGLEYNHGSKNWITFAPAADDMWTAKVGTRGDVYEAYLIQELNLKPISSYLSKAFFRLGFQYYDFEYTGSNNWVGAPVKISEIKPTDLMLLTPLKNAQDIYLTFEVRF